jgi:hypothetical protein
MFTTKRAKKVAKRSWSYAKFRKSVAGAAKDAGVSMKGGLAKVRKCYDDGVTVYGTVKALEASK